MSKRMSGIISITLVVLLFVLPMDCSDTAEVTHLGNEIRLTRYNTGVFGDDIYKVSLNGEDIFDKHGFLKLAYATRSDTLFVVSFEEMDQRTYEGINGVEVVLIDVSEYGWSEPRTDINFP